MKIATSLDQSKQSNLHEIYINIMMRKIVLLTFIATAIFTKSFAQSTNERNAVKEWITENSEHVNLVSSKEFQLMSPAVRSAIQGEAKFLVYNLIVTPQDILKFEEKNSSVDLVKFESEFDKNLQEENKSSVKTKSEPIELSAVEINIVKDWLEGPGKGVKVISNNEYMNLTESQRNSIGTVNVLICKGNSLTSKDIANFEEGN
ncbi:MAG: hypothetical protein ACJASQ_001922 [Crocinitomicaceae bacterium]